MATQHSTVRTRILIVSDTHGERYAEHMPTKHFDVAIHCVDLTEGSVLGEYRTTLNLLRSINAPIKLAIPGNHDITLDPEAFARLVPDAQRRFGEDSVRRDFGDLGDVQALFEAADMRLLGEGTHNFHLANGADLKVYATPYTPSLGDRGF